MHKIIMIFVSLCSMSLLQATDLFQAVETKNHKQINKLLKSNADVDCLNIQGQTVLIKAVQAGNSNLVSKLLKKKAAVNTVDIYGKTALDYAVELNSKRIAKMLLKAEAMVTTESNAFMCKQLVKSIFSNFFTTLLTVYLGLFGMFLVLWATSIVVVTSFSIPLCALSVVLGGCLEGGLIYGMVKIAGKGLGSEDYPVSIMESAA